MPISLITDHVISVFSHLIKIKYDVKMLARESEKRREIRALNRYNWLEATGTQVHRITDVRVTLIPPSRYFPMSS